MMFLCCILLFGTTQKAFAFSSIIGSTNIPVVPAETVANALYEKRDLFKTDIHAIIRCRCDEEDPKYRLAYMPCRNRGEIIRLMLEEAAVPYEVEVVGFAKWEEYVKATTPHGKLPVLRNFDGKGNDLGQEGAIMRFLAEECGLTGENAIQRAEVDSLYCQWFATLRNNGISHDGEHFSIAALKQGDGESQKTSKDVIRYKDMFRQNSFSRYERSLTALKYFEERLSQSKTGFLVGSDAPTYVDLGLFYILFELAEDDNVPDFAERFDLPCLAKFLNRIEQRPHINQYLHSPRRMPRYQRDSETGNSLYTYVAGKYSPEY